METRRRNAFRANVSTSGHREELVVGRSGQKRFNVWSSVAKRFHVGKTPKIYRNFGCWRTRLLDVETFIATRKTFRRLEKCSNSDAIRAIFLPDVETFAQKNVPRRVNSPDVETFFGN